jgi:glycosyltransferase involved in cell wall biosynthesis
MRILLYSQPAGGGMGGTEESVAVLASALRDEHEVEIAHHLDRLTPAALAGRAGVDLTGVQARYLEPAPFTYAWSRNPLRRLQEARLWLRDLSEPYDVFVVFTHDVPPFCYAGRGVLAVLFPFAPRPVVRATGASAALATVTGLFDAAGWRQRFASYDATVSNSAFTQLWTQRRWGVSSEVVYPPVDTDFECVEKEDIILSVGRFAAHGHSKKHVELVDLFGSARSSLPGWTYVCAGDLGTANDDRDYYEQVRRHATRTGATLRPSIPRSELRSLFARAKVFWHGAGLGEDEKVRPEAVEHFGLATVEAMAAGCVPVVVGKGGQREIIEHGVSGFLCETPEQMLVATRRLISDAELLRSVGAAARRRARRFDRRRYLERMVPLCLGT